MLYTLSLVLNLHRENEIAQKTITNLKNILLTKNNWIDIECIVILDNTNKKTAEIVNINKDIFTKVEKVNYGDPALSRNHAVWLSNNNFIVFFDGDDYCSHNILQALYEKFFTHYGSKNDIQTLNDTQHLAVFPKDLVWFPKLSKMRYFDSNECMVENNKFTHCYIAKIAVYKDLLKKYPILPNTVPYGYEDWDLNNRLLDNGVKFKVADYTLYYRKDNIKSVFTRHKEEMFIVRNSSAYSAKSIWKNIQTRIKTFLASYKNNLHVKKDIYVNDIEEDIAFLGLYGELDLDTSNVLFHSSEHYVNNISMQVEVYELLLKVFGRYRHISLSGNVDISETNILQLDLYHDIGNWNLLSEEDRLHIFIKAIINTQVQSVNIGNSDLGQKSLKYHRKIYDEYGIKIQ